MNTNPNPPNPSASINKTHTSNLTSPPPIHTSLIPPQKINQKNPSSSISEICGLEAKNIALIICGALAHEVLAIVQHHQWAVHVVAVPAIVHMYPERIAPAVAKQFQALKEQYKRVIVVFGDCGSQGTLDTWLAENGLERVAGPHCYEMYGGKLFHQLMEEEPGTFFLTDFLVRSFQGTIIKGLGLDRFPELKEDYFRHYRRLVYLVQKENPDLLTKANQVADYLQLPLEIKQTGYGLLEERLTKIMNQHLPHNHDR